MWGHADNIGRRSGYAATGTGGRHGNGCKGPDVKEEFLMRALERVQGEPITEENVGFTEILQKNFPKPVDIWQAFEYNINEPEGLKR